MSIDRDQRNDLRVARRDLPMAPQRNCLSEGKVGFGVLRVSVVCGSSATGSFARARPSAAIQKQIHQIDPETESTLRPIHSDRFVTGVSWTDGELWRGTWENDPSEVRRVDPRTGEVLEKIEMPPGAGVSALECDGGDRFFCGGGGGTVRAVRRPRQSGRRRAKVTA